MLCNFHSFFALLLYLVSMRLFHNKSDFEIMGKFVPPNLFGDRNQCRNYRKWPFVVADPVCLVAHPTSGRPVFDLCAVPLCAFDRKFCMLRFYSLHEASFYSLQSRACLLRNRKRRTPLRVLATNPSPCIWALFETSCIIK